MGSLPLLRENGSDRKHRKAELLTSDDIEVRKQGVEKCLRVNGAHRTRQRESPSDSKFSSIYVELATLKSDRTTSKTIPSVPRSTSGADRELPRTESYDDATARVLASIPRLSGYPRRYRDKCLPCMYRPFETPPERKVSFPRTVLQRILDWKRETTSSPADSSEDSDSTSVGVSKFDIWRRRTLNRDVEREDVTSDERQRDVAEIVTGFVSSSPSSPLRGKHQVNVDTTKQHSVPDSSAPYKTDTVKVAVDGREDDFNSKDSNYTETTLVKGLSLERTKASFHSESSDEEDSIVVSMRDEQPKPKYLVPCHAPTVFRPSLEPLRALRHRKPTTMQDRIALLESSGRRKSASADEHGHVPEKSKPGLESGVNKSQTSDEGKAPPPLTKSRSVSEKLTLETAEELAQKKQNVLRKGVSLSDFASATDFESVKSKMPRDPSKDPLTSTRVNDSRVIVPRAWKSDSKLPLTRPDEIVEVLAGLDEHSSSTTMLDTLCKEFSARLSKRMEAEKDSCIAKRGKMIATLTSLLVDSTRYLYPDKFPSDLLLSANQPICCNPRIIRRVMPKTSYNLVASVLGMPEWYRRKETAMFESMGGSCGRDQWRFSSETSADETMASLVVHPSEIKVAKQPDDHRGKLGQRRSNPYALFLKKPRRKAVTWRPLTTIDLEGYDPDATIKMRSGNVMKRIFEDFCQWVENLGGTDKTIDGEVLKDMFEIDFKAEACKAIQVSIQEMPVVPTEVAKTRNCPGASKLTMTKRHVVKDAMAERRPAKTKAFGTSIPHKLRFVPPKNQVEMKWLRCENVPKDLESMDAIWKGITHLRSVRRFVEWLKEHPEIPQPEALKKMVSMDAMTLKQAEDDEAFAHLELDIEQIQTFRVQTSEETQS